MCLRWGIVLASFLRSGCTDARAVLSNSVGRLLVKFERYLNSIMFIFEQRDSREYIVPKIDISVLTCLKNCWALDVIVFIRAAREHILLLATPVPFRWEIRCWSSAASVVVDFSAKRQKPAMKQFQRFKNCVSSIRVNSFRQQCHNQSAFEKCLNKKIKTIYTFRRSLIAKRKMCRPIKQRVRVHI